MARPVETAAWKAASASSRLRWSSARPASVEASGRLARAWRELISKICAPLAPGWTWAAAVSAMPMEPATAPGVITISEACEASQ